MSKREPASKKTARKVAKKKNAATRTAKKKSGPAKRTTLPKSAARAREAKVDEQLVERTLALLEAQREAAESSRLAIGEHVLDEYFGADVDLALSQSPVKPKSFVALAQRADDEYGWSETDFRFAVRMALAYRSLPTSVRDRIPPSALARLASIDDLAVRRELAAKIASGELRGEAAREAIAEAGAHEARGGRPRLPVALREGRRIVRAVLRLDDTPSFSARNVRELDDAQRHELAEQLDDAVLKLRAMAAALRRRE